MFVVFSRSAYNVHGDQTEVNLKTYQLRTRHPCGRKKTILTIFHCYTGCLSLLIGHVPHPPAIIRIIRVVLRYSMYYVVYVCVCFITLTDRAPTF